MRVLRHYRITEAQRGRDLAASVDRKNRRDRADAVWDGVLIVLSVVLLALIFSGVMA